MDPMTDYRLAATEVSTLLAGLDVADLDRPTPCDGWTVRDLATHLVANSAFFAGAAGATVDDDGDGVGAADARARFDAASDTVMAGFGAPGVLESEIATPYGTFSGAMVLAVAFADLLTHAWDLSRALDARVQVDPAVADHAIQAWEAFIQDDYRATGMFGDIQSCLPDAPALDRVAAFAGRAVTG
jgi:uncharacterized protein (TIGR03086 family)